jgi:hypothetical protein
MTPTTFHNPMAATDRVAPNSVVSKKSVCSKLSIDGDVYDISNLLIPSQADVVVDVPSLYPTLRQGPKRSQKRGRVVPPPRRPLTFPLWVRHNGKTFVEHCTNDSAEALRRIPFFDWTSTVEAIQHEHYTMACCEHCKTSLACIYGLEYVLCTCCNRFSSLMYGVDLEVSTDIIPFGVGAGLTHKRIVEALALFGTEACHISTNKPAQRHLEGSYTKGFAA